MLLPIWKRILPAVLLALVLAPSHVLAQDDLGMRLSGKDWKNEPIERPATPVNATTADYDLRRSVMRGLEANPLIMEARSAVKAGEYSRLASLGAFGPSATVNYSYEHRQPALNYLGTQTQPDDLWTFNLNINQPLFTGFRLLSQYQKASLQEELSYAQLDNAELQLILAIQSNFLNLLRARMDVKSADDEVTRLQSQLKVSNAFFEVGLKPRLDVLEAEVQLADAEQNLVIAKNAVDTTISQLNTLLDLPLENDTNYVGDLNYLPFSLALDECLRRAYDKRPDIYIGQKSVEIAGEDADISSSTFYPQVEGNFDYYKLGDQADVDGSKYFTDDSQADYWTVGAGVSWKFFEWGKNYHEWKAAKENVSQLRSSLEDTVLNAGYEVKDNLLAIKAASDRIRAARKAVEAAKESYRMSVARYQAQVGTSTDVLDNQARLTRSEAQLNKALADYQIAIAQLYVAMGEANPGLVTN